MHKPTQNILTQDTSQRMTILLTRLNQLDNGMTTNTTSAQQTENGYRKSAYRA